MGSSPDLLGGADPVDPTDPTDPDDAVRWPLVAKLGAALAIVTLVGIIVAAVLAAFVIGPKDDDQGAGPRHAPAPAYFVDS